MLACLLAYSCSNSSNDIGGARGNHLNPTLRLETGRIALMRHPTGQVAESLRARGLVTRPTEARA